MTATEKGVPVKILLRTVLLATLGLGLLASPAAAASYKRVIKPSQLLPVWPQATNGRTSAFVQGVGVEWIYYSCPLVLPPGKIITGLSFQHVAGGSTIAVVDLAAANPGQTPASVVVYEAVSNALVATPDFVTVTGSPVSGVSKKVLRGWQYYISVGISNSQGNVADVVVSYRDP